MENILRKQDFKLTTGKSFEKKILNIVYKPIVKWYSGRIRPYRYKDIRIRVFPGVFHPGVYLSTKVFLEYLEFVNVYKQRVLELGTGTGLISIICALDGAYVTASDSHSLSIRNAEFNKRHFNEEISKRGGKLETIESDLFGKIPRQVFDLIIINPPFLYGKAKTFAEHTIRHTASSSYFENLFSSLNSYANSESEILMILSDHCDQELIHDAAQKHALGLKCVLTKKHLMETNYVFRVERNGSLTK